MKLYCLRTQKSYYMGCMCCPPFSHPCTTTKGCLCLLACAFMLLLISHAVITAFTLHLVHILLALSSLHPLTFLQIFSSFSIL